MINIDIIGSCFTRELFNTNNKYKVNVYLMLQSIYTMFSEPLKVNRRDIRSHDDYSFKNRMLYNG